MLKANRGEDVAYQVSEMVEEAVHRALIQLSGGTPVGFRPLGEGGQYQFTGPVDDSPPAQFEAAVEEKLKEEPNAERPGNRDDSVSWVF